MGDYRTLFYAWLSTHSLFSFFSGIVFFLLTDLSQDEQIDSSRIKREGVPENRGEFPFSIRNMFTNFLYKNACLNLLYASTEDLTSKPICISITTIYSLLTLSS